MKKTDPTEAAISLEEARDRRTAWALALVLHLGLAAVLLLLRGQWPRSEPEKGSGFRVMLRLTPPPEVPRAALLAAASLPGVPEPDSEERLSGEADNTDSPDRRKSEEVDQVDGAEHLPPPPPPRKIDEETLRELARERDELRHALAEEQDKANAIAERAAVALAGGNAPRPSSGGASRGHVPIGTVRELDLEGYPEPVVQEIMARYNLRVTEKSVTGSTNQNFLSSASTAGGGRFIADRNSGPGVYQVFMLSPKAVAAMSRLEEEEIRKRGMDPMSARVTRVRFGIVGHPPETDLGILLFEAEPLEN